MSIAIVDAAPFANPKRARHTCPDVKDTTDCAFAIARARKFAAQLKIEEKVNITLAPGVDIFGRCVWNAATILRLNWPGLRMEDRPLGVHFADFASASRRASMRQRLEMSS
ncbi:hypothetical protein C8F01DRAFT_1256007 [Mycena amicta]|nr:hypothetical protein C8F01DRAFT_1256007 [Mycena amicta]